MGVSCTPDGRWHIVYRDRETKKLKKEYFGRGVQGEVAAKNRFDTLNIRQYGRSPERYAPTFKDIVKSYFRDKQESLTKSTIDGMMPKVLSIYLPMLGHYVADRIDDERIHAYISERLKKVKRTTIHRELSDIRAILNWAVRKRIILSNPMVGVTFPRRDDEHIMPPSVDEVRRLLEHSQEHLKRAIIIGWYCGLRMGQELFSRRWHDVDWDNRTLYIVSAEKGGLETRRIPISSELCPLLLKWYADDDEDDDLPIIHWRSKRISKIKTAWNRAKSMAGIKRRLTPYSIRHAFVSDLIDASGDAKTVGAMAGHKDISTTMFVYHHTTSDRQRRIVEQRQSILGNKKSSPK